MYGVLFTCFLQALVHLVSAGGTGDKNTLDRLDATEKLVNKLLDRVEFLETQDILHSNQIEDLQSQLHLQKQRTSYLEALIADSYQKTNPAANEAHPGLIPENQNVTGKEVIKIRKVDDETPNRIRRANNEAPVAFFATMVKHLEHAGIQQQFVFENVVTNVGNAYHGHIGSFIAPVAGTYVFSTTLVSFYHVNANAQFVKNGQPITTLYVSGGESGHDTTSQTIVLNLQKGDDVVIHNVDIDKSFYGLNHSLFSGFLLQEDFSSSPAVVGK